MKFVQLLIEEIIGKIDTGDKLLDKYLKELGKVGLLAWHPDLRQFVFDNIDNDFNKSGKYSILSFNRFNKKNKKEINLAVIQASQIRKGIGSSTMKALVGVADKLGYKMALDAEPFGSNWDQKRISLSKLVKFYKKYGFVVDLKAFDGEDPFKSDAEYVKYAKKAGEGVQMYRNPK